MYPPCTLVPRRYKSGYILGTFGYMAHFMYPCPTPIEGGAREKGGRETMKDKAKADASSGPRKWKA